MTTADKRYASRTSVSPEKSKGEIEATLRRYGADQFMYGWEDGRGVVWFRLNGLPVRMVLPLPRLEEFRHFEQKTAYGTRLRQRTEDAAVRACEQAERQCWRALLLVVKAKLEAVEAGITTVEQEFLANMVLPDNSTVSETLIPRLHEAVVEGRIPPMLPSGESGQIPL